MTMRIQITPSRTYLVVETDVEEKTITILEEFDNILDAEDYIIRWQEVDDAWDMNEDYIG